MPAGADKGFTFDPPGAIGLVAGDALVMLRFHDPDVTVRPKDEAGALNDLDTAVDANATSVGPAACGNGRVFNADDASAMSAVDLVGGSSLVTRDLTIMAIVSWDIANQSSVGPTAVGVLVCRGDGSSAPEQICYELRLTIVDEPTNTGSIALAWQDTSGAMHVQTGAQFVCPSGFTLLTATRRWASPTEVVCHYYIGDVLLAEIWSADGSIGGSTLGTFTLGAHRVGGTLNSLFGGTLDELAVFDREMCIEEIADIWQRITVLQPLGVQLLREMHDPGFPISDDPSSDVQLEIRQAGMALGYAASLVENFRRNILPQHSYGNVLELWEQALRPTRLPTQLPDSGIDARRARVLARMRQRGGSSVPAIEGILGGLLGGADVSQLEFLAGSNTFADDFTTIDPLRWDIGHAGGVTAASGAAHFAPGAGSIPAPVGMALLQRSVGEGRQAHQIVKLTFTTAQDKSEAGVFFGDAGLGNYVLFGLRKDTGTFILFSEVFAGGASLGAVVRFPLGGLVSPIWLHLYQTEVDGTWAAQYSTTSPTSGFTSALTFAGPSVVHWAGCYLRSTGTLGGAPVADFDDHLLYTPFGLAPFNAYVLLDRALGFVPDLPGARQCIAAIKHAFIRGTFITAPKLICDDQDNGCDTAPCGGYG